MTCRLSMLWLCVVLFVASCGISDIPFFSAASVNHPIPGDSIVQIEHNTANNANSFFGYNIYYKLYRDGDIGTISSDKSYITDTTRQPTPSVITTRGFMRLQIVKFDKNASSSTFKILPNYPTIRPANKNSAQSFYLDFTANPDAHGNLYTVPSTAYDTGLNSEKGYQALLVINGIPAILARNLNSDTDTKSFFDTRGTRSYQKSDYDIQKMIPKYSPGDPLSLVIAVIPYGLDISAVQRVYGTIAMSSTAMPIDYDRTP